MELSELIESIDIVEYISQFIDLEQRGDEWWGLSCFKEEKTPSFSVRKMPPCFFDYSSGIGGNVFTFTKFYFHCSAQDAIKKLQEYLGNDSDATQKHKKLDATRVCSMFKKPLKTCKTRSGVVLPDDYMLKYEKRPDKLAVWAKEGISEESMSKFQVFYDAFSDRLVYPIKNMRGEIVNVGGRTLDPSWKEKNLRKYTYFFPWGTLDTIYGAFDNMQDIKTTGEIIIFEGCKSVLMADTWGIHNTGALLTSHLNPNQMKILAKLGCKVVFALDSDVDIKSDHNINKLCRYVSVYYIKDTDNLLGPKDSPVDKGKEVFELLYDKRIKYAGLL